MQRPITFSKDDPRRLGPVLHWYKSPRYQSKHIFWGREETRDPNALTSDPSPVKDWLGPIFHWYECPLCGQTFGDFMSYHQHLYHLDNGGSSDEFKCVESEQRVKEKRNPKIFIITGHPMPCGRWGYYPHHCNKTSASDMFRNEDGGCNYFGRRRFKCGIPMYNLLQETSLLDVLEEIS